jgi:hypothetical protein
VPPRKIHVVAIGSEDPNAENKTRADRKENRRVDVRVYSLNLNAGNQGMGTSGNSMPQQSAPNASTNAMPQGGTADRSADVGPQQ